MVPLNNRGFLYDSSTLLTSSYSTVVLCPIHDPSTSPQGLRGDTWGTERKEWNKLLDSASIPRSTTTVHQMWRMTEIANTFVKLIVHQKMKTVLICCCVTCYSCSSSEPLDYHFVLPCDMVLHHGGKCTDHH